MSREDFMAVRKAAQSLESSQAYAFDDSVTLAQAALLRQASARELDFIQMATRSNLHAPLIDLAYALLGEVRAGLSATAEANVIDRGQPRQVEM